MLATLLDELGISGWTLKINSVGSASDRPAYIEAAARRSSRWFRRCARTASAARSPIPCACWTARCRTISRLSMRCPRLPIRWTRLRRAHFAAVCAALDAAGVPYERDHRLVRGLDYYTRTTFEFTHDAGLGTQNALLGGGRYDGLSELIGGPKAPGIGFAMGEDRLVLTLQAQEAGKAELADAYIAPLGEAQNPLRWSWLASCGVRLVDQACGSSWAMAASGSRNPSRPRTRWRARSCCWARMRRNPVF
jgi:histidyl-tRNA synthetase